MAMKGSKRLLRADGAPVYPTMGRPPMSPEEKQKRVEFQAKLDERKKLKKELILAALQEKSRLKRPKGRPPKDPTDPTEPKPVKKPKSEREPQTNRRAERDPVTGRMIYRKGNPGPEKKIIDRPPTDYDNISLESIYKKYGV
jgi:hypothetical protein